MTPLAGEDRPAPGSDHPSLAPAPDFRYVGLEPGPPPHPGLWASYVAVGPTLGAGVRHERGLRAALVAAIGAGASALAVRHFGGSGRAMKAMGAAPFVGRSDAVSMAIVPWGILGNQPDVAPRILRWAAVKDVNVEMIYGRDGGTPTTLWSIVTIETEHERLAGRTPGAVYIERLIAHVSAYADEQAQAIALDVRGAPPPTAGSSPSSSRSFPPRVRPSSEWGPTRRASVCRRAGTARRRARRRRRSAFSGGSSPIARLAPPIRDRSPPC